MATIRRAMAILTVLSLAPPSPAGQNKRTYYTVQHPDQFAIDWAAFYDRAEAMTDQTRRLVPHHLDLAYGKDPKQRLDVYEAPDDALRASSRSRRRASREGGTPRRGGAPVFIFLHGGGFREGDRRQYGYVAGALAPNGVVTVVPSYRLLPDHYPAQAQDTEAIVAWVHANIQRFGGDPGRIYIGGHSAGAIMSTFAALKRDWVAPLRLPLDVIKGVVAVSGPYDLRQATGFVADYLPDPATRAGASPLLHVAPGAPPMIVAFGTLEAPYVKGSSEFVDALVRAGADARLIPLAGMQHDATALSLGQAEGAVVRAMLALMH
jgi:acetyl esterase/lipase